MYYTLPKFLSISFKIFQLLACIYNRVLTNSKFGLFYSNFLILTPTLSKVPIEKYGKTPIFSVKQHFYSYFQNPSENSVTTRACILRSAGFSEARIWSYTVSTQDISRVKHGRGFTNKSRKIKRENGNIPFVK